MGGRVWIAGELQRPAWNWEQQEEGIGGLTGPATEEVQSMVEQGIWKRVGLCSNDIFLNESNL